MKSKAEVAASAKRRRLWVLFRITPEEQAAVEEFQNTHPPFDVLMEASRKIKRGMLGTDHHHGSGLIRGRLGAGINKALGIIENLFQERTGEILRALAAYYDNPPAVQVLGKRYGMIGRAKINKKKKLYGPTGTTQ